MVHGHLERGNDIQEALTLLVNMAESTEEVKEGKIQFKKKSKKPLRQRKESSDESDGAEDGEYSSKIDEMKTLQRLRNRPNGVNVVSLALGQNASNDAEDSATDPFKVKSGGMVNMKALKSGSVKQVDDAYDVGIGTQFSAETNKRDEDEEMMKYIEEQLSKKKKKLKEENEDGERSENSTVDEAHKYMSPEEAALQAVPDHLRASTTHRSEEMLSNQMLSGIPEVDLGIDAKIRNIEATEEAKLKLLWERHNKKDGPSQFVPTNMAVNFVQFNRFNIEESGPPRKNWRADQPAEKRKKSPVANSDGHKDEKRRDTATDDYHYEKFKKQFRRY